jgi:hypothetical protein
VKLDEVDRRIGLSIKAGQVSDEEFKLDESMLEGLRPGEDMVDLGSAFDDAFSGLEGLEEWHPGDK